MKIRPDLVPAAERENLEVFQLTDESIPSSHVYMEAQIFTPDSRRLVLHRSAHPHGSDPKDPEHRYMICDLEDHCRLAPLTTEAGTTAPSISPDGKWLYYFVDETDPANPGPLTLKRVGMDGFDREVIYVLDHPVPGTDFRLSRPYPLSTLSSDGRRIAISGFLGDGRTEGAPWGLLVFEIVEPSVRLVFHGPTWCNIHPQYTRQTDADASHDIMIQENHGNVASPDGRIEKLTSGRGADIHLIRDDGTSLRDFPWGRDGNEFCQGHQCWVGRGERAVTSTSRRQPRCAGLIEGRAVPHAGHVGLRTPGGERNDLTRRLPEPDFWHFATDIAGRRLISDSGPRDGGGGLWLGSLPADGRSPVEDWTWLLNPRSTWRKESHIHPFLSPDGRTGFFNSDESGVHQCYMVRGWEGQPRAGQFPKPSLS